MFASQKNANGEYVGVNGKYVGEDGSVHIDLNSGDNGQGVMAYTLSHEVTHFAEKHSAKLFDNFSTALFEALDISVDAAVNAKANELLEKNPQKYRNASHEKLMEDAKSEVVARCCETMLTDTDAMQEVGRLLQKKDASGFRKIVNYIGELVKKLRDAYAKLNPDSKLAAVAKDTISKSDTLYKMWAEMVVDAGQMYQNSHQGSQNSVANSDDVLYSKKGKVKVFFKKNVFPPYNESHSDAHERAERWARKDTTFTGDRKVAHCLGQWYLAEAFDGLEYGYQIVSQIPMADLKKEMQRYGVLERADGKGPRRHAVAYPVGEQPNGSGGRGYNSSDILSEHRGETGSLRQMDDNEDERRNADGQQGSNYASGGENRQGRAGQSALNDDTLASDRAADEEYLDLAKDPVKNRVRLEELVKKAAQDAGYTMTQYHGTDADFTEFKIGDVGYHVGTRGQAESRLKDLMSAGVKNWRGSNPKVMELMVKIDNPLWAAFDFGDWHGKNVASMLAETEQFEGEEN